jgi:hypothetical protein
MEETQHNLNDEPDKGRELRETAPSSSPKSSQRILAVIFGLMQLAWLGWLAFVAWKVLSS